MRVFNCPACGAAAFFSNLRCACGAELFFDPVAEAFALNAAGCVNRQMIACNWRADGEGADLCRSCAMTEVIPDTFRGSNTMLWASAETSKRWVLLTLGRWGWFTGTDTGELPRFHLLSENTASGSAVVTMGHENGLVTINLAEADAVEKIQRREALSERLRNMTVHFRHEIAHFLFARLTGMDGGFLEQFRSVFGDERADYNESVQNYYSYGPPANWNENFITPYASSHPHEDWAETAAHVMHLTDILDSAVSVRLLLPPLSNLDYDAYAETNAEALIDAAAAYGIALNHVNRAMGHDDIYPFIHSPAVRQKLKAAHGWIARLAA